MSNQIGGSVFEGDSPVGLASWTRGSAWWTRQWNWRVAVHVAGPVTRTDEMLFTIAPASNQESEIDKSLLMTTFLASGYGKQMEFYYIMNYKFLAWHTSRKTGKLLYVD
ncbi:hypothetical protein HKD37_10G027437 [Glycine soja]